MLDQLERTAKGKPRTGDELARGERESEGRSRPEGELGFIFQGLGSFFDLAAKLASEATEEDGEVVRSGEGRSPGVGLGYMYGFTVRAGPGGRPIIDQFGNIRRTESGSIVTETREPVADVFDERDEVVVIVELPGVEEQQIDVEVRAGEIEVSAAGRGRRYHKRVLLPSPVTAGSLTSSYRNGILEIRCRKAGGRA
jgi:HSP20 family protein